MISSSDMWSLIILMMKPAHVIFQNKSRTINVSVVKEKPTTERKMRTKNVKRNI